MVAGWIVVIVSSAFLDYFFYPSAVWRWLFWMSGAHFRSDFSGFRMFVLVGVSGAIHLVRRICSVWMFPFIAGGRAVEESSCVVNAATISVDVLSWKPSTLIRNKSIASDGGWWWKGGDDPPDWKQSTTTLWFFCLVVDFPFVSRLILFASFSRRIDPSYPNKYSQQKNQIRHRRPFKIAPSIWLNPEKMICFLFFVAFLREN